MIDRAKKYISDEEIQDILVQLCKGLKNLHQRDIIHRDINLNNIMLTNDGIIKLVDFDTVRIFKYNQNFDTTYLGTKALHRQNNMVLARQMLERIYML